MICSGNFAKAFGPHLLNSLLGRQYHLSSTALSSLAQKNWAACKISGGIEAAGIGKFNAHDCVSS